MSLVPSYYYPLGTSTKGDGAIDGRLLVVLLGLILVTLRLREQLQDHEVGVQAIVVVGVRGCRRAPLHVGDFERPTSRRPTANWLQDKRLSLIHI